MQSHFLCFCSSLDSNAPLELLLLQSQASANLSSSVGEQSNLRLSRSGGAKVSELGFQVAFKEHRIVALMAGVAHVGADVTDVVADIIDTNVVVNDKSQKPLFSFAVITDVQYADIDDSQSFLGVPRFYRHSLESLHRAVDAWNRRGGLAFAIHFGDIVDGKCPKDKTRIAFDSVLSEFKAFRGGPVYHMIGNHCLYNLPRPELNQLLGIPPSTDSDSYYSFTPYPGFLFVVLDGYDVSALGWPVDHPHTKAALHLLETKNPNSDKNSPDGLSGTERRFVMFNGGLGEQQLKWLETVLEEATTFEQKVIICCHLPLHPGAAYPSTLLWNFEEVLQILHKFDCVLACIGGHAHEGGHVVDSHGVHHHVLEAVLECPPGTDAYGHVDVFPTHLSLHGTDRMASSEMYFK